MELKDILPLIGVVIGWFLKELADSFRQRHETHAHIGKVIVRLFQLHDEVRRLTMHQEFMKDRPGSWNEYEKFRVRAANRYLDKRGDVQQTIDEAVELVSARWPFDAVALGHVKVLLTFYYKTDLGTLSADREKYVMALSTLEVTLDLSELLLRRLILKLARMYSILTWIRVRWVWRRHSGKIARKNKEFSEKWLTEFYDKIDSKGEPAEP